MGTKNEKKSETVIPEDFDWDTSLEEIEHELPGDSARFRLHEDKTYTRSQTTVLAESITANGLILPIVVWVDPDEPKLYHVVDGCHRILAMVAAGIKMPDNGIRVISKPDAAEGICLRLLLQGSPTGMSTAEKASLLAELRESTDWTFQEIERRTGIPSSTIVRLSKRMKKLQAV